MADSVSDLLDSFSVPQVLTAGQSEKVDDIRRSAFLFARQIESSVSRVHPASAKYREQAIELIRTAMLLAVEGVNVEAVATQGRRGFATAAAAARSEDLAAKKLVAAAKSKA